MYALNGCAGGDHTDLSYSLAFHCAPAIEGVKAANLVSLNKKRYQNFEQCFRKAARQLCVKDVYFYKLSECAERLLLLVYQREQLRHHLVAPEQSAFLEHYGYHPREMTLPQMLHRLRHRLRRCKQEAYPHEIGAFLGYPIEDVQGFIAHAGASYALCGYWKVYHNPARARETFRTYDALRRFYCDRVAQGETIHTIHHGRN